MMKKRTGILLALLMTAGLMACGNAPKQEAVAEGGFQPALDKDTSCHIRVAGGYDNFEALEAEFDRFNEYYPNAEMMFTKIDDYNNMIGTVLEGNDAPDIYVNYSWMYGREQYQSSINHAEDLSDPQLGLDLDCIRSNIILKTEDGTLPMVPVFANTYGMLVNNSLFEKEGLNVPTTYQELVDVCEAFRKKGYENPMMGFSKEETTSLFTLNGYPYFCGTVADDAEAIKKLNSMDPAGGEYMRPTLEKIEQFLGDGCVNIDACNEIENNYDAVILRFFEGDVPMMTASGDTVSGTESVRAAPRLLLKSRLLTLLFRFPWRRMGLTFWICRICSSLSIKTARILRWQMSLCGF
ncbi:MAG: carbohydrate ABC transporter substrate-binding protein [Lachnospiraceae bacterium]|nr:carbohydrate ABC transporter substrate-binding protein [Lachnospiraceae bacterium]